MKKLKYLPLLGASLLALTSCGGANNEISEVKALSLYTLAEAEQYTLANIVSNSDIDADIKLMFQDGVFSNIPEFEAGFVANPLTCFFGQAKADDFKTLANYFQEFMTYTLDGKSLTAEFTGSNENEEYGIAMNCSFKYQSAGLLKSAHYTFAYSTDSNHDGKIESSVYHGDVNLTWQKA